MPTFSTPTPIDLAINLPVGRIDVAASDRSDTVVTVTPGNPSKAADVRGAAETKVAFDGERLTVIGPKPRIAIFGPNETVNVTVELPTGSRLTAETAMGGVHTVGLLGATRVKSSMGSVQLDVVGDLWLRASMGNAIVGTADGSVEITADHGQIRIGAVTGDATLKASHGNIQIGESGGDVDARLSYGDLEITSASASVTGKTVHGSVTIGEVASGSIQVETSLGSVDIGVRTGVAAWLDLGSKNGNVRNELDGDGAPSASEDTVSVRARTQLGDITLHRTR